MSLELLRLHSIQTAPRRAVLQTLNMWCTPLSDAVAQFDGGDLVVSDTQVRIRVSLTPTLRRMARTAANLEAQFRGGTWRVTGRREIGLDVVFTLDPERGVEGA